MPSEQDVNDHFDAGTKAENPIVPKKKRAPRKTKVKHMRSAPWHIALQPLILQSTILPLLRSIITSTPNIGGPGALYLTFCSRCEAKVSRSVFNSWLKDLGITFHQTTTFSLPTNQDAPVARKPLPPLPDFSLNDHHKGIPATMDGGGVTPPDADDGDVQFANETPRDTAAISAQHSLAAASLNADMPLSPSGIPTDQVIITPALSKFLQ